MNSKANSKTKIKAKAPTRIDLAGGTLDIWPLYLFVESPVTLNLGIDLYAEAEITADESGPASVALVSEDQKLEKRFAWNDVLEGDAQAEPAVELHFKLLRHFAREHAATGQKPKGSLELRTRAKSPAGAGLGGSSTLSIAMIGALATWARGNAPDVEKEGERLIEIARDVETTVIRVPAGLQDYYGAMFGGLQALRWGAGAHRRDRLPETALPGLQDRLMLFYSGQSRNSGINNWALFKAYIDGDPGVRAKFDALSEAAADAEAALRRLDWDAARKAIADEWETRRTLAPGISTAEIDAAFKEARGVAPIAMKICGAGGGGCLFALLPDSLTAEARARIEGAFTGKGMRRLPFHAAARGLEVSAGSA